MDGLLCWRMVSWEDGFERKNNVFLGGWFLGQNLKTYLWEDGSNFSTDFVANYFNAFSAICGLCFSSF